MADFFFSVNFQTAEDVFSATQADITQSEIAVAYLVTSQCKPLKEFRSRLQ